MPHGQLPVPVFFCFLNLWDAPCALACYQHCLLPWIFFVSSSPWEWELSQLEDSELNGSDMDIEVTGCLIYGVGENGENVGYDTGVGSLWERFVENR